MLFWLSVLSGPAGEERGFGKKGGIIPTGLILTSQYPERLQCIGMGEEKETKNWDKLYSSLNEEVKRHHINHMQVPIPLDANSINTCLKFQLDCKITN